MKLVEVKTSCDGSVKNVFEARDGLPIEVAVLRKPTKDVLVLPTATGCKLGCKFCPLTYAACKGAVRFLTPEELAEASALSLPKAYEEPQRASTLLFSLMGVGEPLAHPNLMGVFEALNCVALRADYSYCRFGVASIIPSVKAFGHFSLAATDYDVKLHWSLHFTKEEQREEILPSALPVWAALPLVRKYALTQKTEAHYTLIKDVNDLREDCERLALMFAGTDTTVKLLTFSEPGECCDGLKASSLVGSFAKGLRTRGVRDVEIYDPPGRDICASCGMFETERYL
jgi:23S rRNA (adenine2503-C2)-methyltransferase